MGAADTTQTGTAPYLSSAALREVQPFSSEISFRFDPKINVLIGPNGVGKSTALAAFAGVYRSRFVSEQGSPEEHGQDDGVSRATEPVDNLERMTTLYVGPTRIALDPDTIVHDLHQIDVQESFAYVLHVARRAALVLAGISLLGFLAMVIGQIFPKEIPWLYDIGRVGTPIFAAILTASYTGYFALLWTRRNLLTLIPMNRLLSSILNYRPMVSSVFMFQVVQILNRKLLGTAERPADNQRARAAIEAAELAVKCAHSVASEAFARTASLDSAMIRSFGKTISTRWFNFRQEKAFYNHLSNVDTRFSQNPLHIADLSSGTQGPLLIAWTLALKLAISNGFQPGWESQPAILYIDEIENHLHPTWQRRFIPAFLEHFPNLQIFATTHSPFPIAGLKAGQVHKLFRAHDGSVMVEVNDYDIVGWTADEILHEFLDVVDPTDLDTARAVEILRWLDELYELTDEESAEVWRLTEVDHLDNLISLDVASPEETIVALWLKGEIDIPVPLNPPLAGEAEEWRSSAVADFRSVVGVDILSGGPAARQRQMRDEEDYPTLGS